MWTRYRWKAITELVLMSKCGELQIQDVRNRLVGQGFRRTAVAKPALTIFRLAYASPKWLAHPDYRKVVKFTALLSFEMRVQLCCKQCLLDYPPAHMAG